jgi:hypothetical protein
MRIVFDDKRFQMFEVGPAHVGSPRDTREQNRAGNTLGDGKRDLTLQNRAKNPENTL